MSDVIMSDMLCSSLLMKNSFTLIKNTCIMTNISVIV